MMQLGKFYHENLTKEKVDEILELCRQGSIAID
jgi:NADH-quinone oxidoreductase subunit E